MPIPFVFATMPAGNVPASDLDDNFTYVLGQIPAIRWTQGEIPSGALNGINKIFTLAQTPTSGIAPVINNATLFYGTDFTVSGNTITLGAGTLAPNSANGDTLYVPPYTY